MPHEAGIGPAPQVARRTAPRTAEPRASRSSRESFAESLSRQEGARRLKFSAHASARLASRNIRFSPEEMGRVEQAARLAAQRGSRDALLMMDNLGLVVNIKNHTVLTALDLQKSQGGIVTNIDSTVVVGRGN